ncbi:hypothetical protein BD311DRAFT_669608 [Dichomitus squalens]|uniref:Mid2 domain-containing protein n=1 Tax=Dichomitus squalens TaxID=114155 RepID=A0A4Q9MFI3_9APHY|nr:hypothetical protein BD311DRAFT_669608 [Dichomitus squalens]
MSGLSHLLRVDDTSSRLVYNGSWAPGSVSDGVTIHTSTSAGSTVKFAFNGTFVAVYGVIDGDSVTASFALDNLPPVSASVPQPPESTTENWPFFSTNPPLDPGLHELTVIINDGTFNLDYVQYVTLPGHSDSPGDSSQVQATSSSSTSSSSTSSLIPAHSQLPLGAIVGIVAGAVLLLVIVAVAVFVRRRSARRVRHVKLDSEKPIDIIYDNAPKSPPVAARRPLRRFSLSGVYRPTPPRSTQSSKTATSSAPTSITQSSAMFTSVIMLSPVLSMVSEESGHPEHDASSYV